MVWCRIAVKDKTWRQTDMVQTLAISSVSPSVRLGELITPSSLGYSEDWIRRKCYKESLGPNFWHFLGILWVISTIITFIYLSTHFVIHPTMHPFQPLQQILLFESQVGRDVREEKQAWNRRRDYIIKQGPVASQTSVMPGPPSLVLPWQATGTYLLMATQRWCDWDCSVSLINRKFCLRQWRGKMGHRWVGENFSVWNFNFFLLIEG